jgi:hypothetical protein
MAGSADTSLLQPFPFSIVHAYSHSVCTSNWVSSQAKPLSPTLPLLHNNLESSIAILTHSLDQVTGTTRESPQPSNSSPQPSILQQQQHSKEHIAYRTNILYPATYHTNHTHDRIPHRQPSLLPSQTGGVRSLKEPFVRPIHQTAGRPSLPPCRTYGSPSVSSD